MSIPLIITRGYGNGTLSGTIKDVVLRGYSIGEAAVQYAMSIRRISISPLLSAAGDTTVLLSHTRVASGELLSAESTDVIGLSTWQ